MNFMVFNEPYSSSLLYAIAMEEYREQKSGINKIFRDYLKPVEPTTKSLALLYAAGVLKELEIPYDVRDFDRLVKELRN